MTSHQKCIATTIPIVFATAQMVVGDLITFNNDPVAGFGGPFVSVDSSHVAFHAAPGGSFRVWGSGEWQLDGNALNHKADPDDPGPLEIEFDHPATAVAFYFGGDAPGQTRPGDEAVLRAFREEHLVGESRVVMNRDLIINQTISFSGPVFDEVHFHLMGPWISNALIDNVTFTLAPDPVPIPGDMTGDGFVGADDLAVLINRWNTFVTGGDQTQGDLTGDGYVGADDLAWMIDAWNTGTLPVAATSVPEPATVALLTLLLVAVQARRSRCCTRSVAGRQ